MELPPPKRIRGVVSRETDPAALLREAEAGQLSGRDIGGSGARLAVPEGSADGKVGAPEARAVSLGPDAMGDDSVIEPMLGHADDGTLGHEGTGADEHETTGADELMEEMLGSTEDGPENEGTERITMVEYMVREAWMNWEQSLREAHRHRRMAQVVTTFGWLLGPERVGWGLVPAERFSAEEAARYATWRRLYVSQPEGFEEERMAADAFGLEG